jgi:hypothetical protein
VAGGHGVRLGFRGGGFWAGVWFGSGQLVGLLRGEGGFWNRSST